MNSFSAMQNSATLDLIFWNKFDVITIMTGIQFVVRITNFVQLTLKFWSYFFPNKNITSFLILSLLGESHPKFFWRIKIFINITIMANWVVLFMSIFSWSNRREWLFVLEAHNFAKPRDFNYILKISKRFDA